MSYDYRSQKRNSRLYKLKEKFISWLKSMTWKRGIKLTLLAVGIAALIIVGLFLYRTVINPKAAFNTQATSHSSEAPMGPGETPVPTTQANVREEFRTNRVNILVLGMDSNLQREATVREDFRTDTMLLVSIDFDNKKVDMITVPRDSYVTVTKATGKLYKVNSAAFFGGGMCDSGFLNACDTISGVFGGLPVNYYVAADMDGLKALVDAIGGVYFDVDISASLDGVTLTEGYQLLDGQKALTYCRLRKGLGKDVDRQERQQQLLVSVFKTLKSNGKIENVGPIYESLKDMVYTNLTFEQICALGVFFSGFDNFDNISNHVLKGEYHWAYGVYFYLLDQKDKANLVKDIFGKKIEIDKKHDINYVLANTSDDDKKDQEESDPEDADQEPVPEKSTQPTDPASNTQAPSSPAPSTEVSPPATTEPTTAPTDTVSTEPVPGATDTTVSSDPAAPAP